MIETAHLYTRKPRPKAASWFVVAAERAGLNGTFTSAQSARSLYARRAP